MHEIRRADFQGRTIPKENQREYDAWDTFNAYCKNVAASRDYNDFCGTGQEVSRMLDVWWHRRYGNGQMPKKAIVIGEIMQSEESFVEFKRWFHEVFLKK
jgi:hypothetical protein